MSLEFDTWWKDCPADRNIRTMNYDGLDICRVRDIAHAVALAAWNAALQHAEDKLNEEAPDASAQDPANASIEE